MKSSAKKVELASVDDLFSTGESRADAQREKVLEIPLSELHPFKDHPFKVKDDEAMMETADSVRQYGVLVPAIARPDPEGGYELVAGHRRHRASELAEKETMPVIVRDLDDDAATIIMVDSNLQRESLLPSERAFAYRMKLDAMKETVDSVRQYGVLVPAIARPDPEGGYELVAGHRRHRASELAGKETMPVIVRDLDDDAATIIMVDSNLQRESLLPSERAFAYKMKLEAIKHQAKPRSRFW